MTLLVCGVAGAVDRRRARRTPSAHVLSGSAPQAAPELAGGGSAARRRLGAALAAGITASSVCCGVYLFSWIAEFVDLRLSSPDP